MTCDEALALLSAELDGELTENEQAGLRAHLAACPDCRRAREELRRADDGLKGLQEDPPETLAPSVMKKIRREREKRAERRNFLFSAAFLASAAAIFVLLSGMGLIRVPGFGRGHDAAAAISGFRITADAGTQEAQKLADERGCAVLLLRTDAQAPTELSGLAPQTLADGSALYETTHAVLASLQKSCAQTCDPALFEPSGSYRSDADAPACVLLIK
jgi:predicted anti-sigma-YlaC factor YlaD